MESLIPGWIAAIFTALGVLCEIGFRVFAKKAWREDLLKDLEIYERISSDSTLANKEIRRAVKKKIETEIEANYLPKKPSGLIVFLYSTAMLTASIVICAIAGFVASWLGMLTPELILMLIATVGGAAGVEAIINIVTFFRGRPKG